MVDFLTSKPRGKDCTESGMELEEINSDVTKASYDESITWDSEVAIAFPPISTEDFDFPEDQAGTLAAEEIFNFLETTIDKDESATDELKERVRIVFSVPLGSSPCYSAFQRAIDGCALVNKRSLGRVRLLEGSLVQLADLGCPCRILVNPCNWMLSARGGLTNTSVHQAAGPLFEKDSQKIYPDGIKQVGFPCPVSVPSDTCLYRQRTKTVLHVLGPNMNPNRPYCLDSEAIAGDLFQECYRNCLEYFWREVKRRNSIIDSNTTDMQSKDNGEVKEELPPGMQPFGWTSTFPRYCHPGKAASSGGAWKNVLFEFLRYPKRHQRSIYHQDDSCIVIYDGYPKAKIHLLLIPKPEFLRANRISDISKSDLCKVKILHKRAWEIARFLEGSHTSTAIKIGYHAIPSLHPLHIHIISEDFDSPCIKNKKHWNSFTTDFFIKTSELELKLESLSSPLLKCTEFEEKHNRYEAILKTDMQCFRCYQNLKNIPALKSHVFSHCK